MNTIPSLKSGLLLVNKPSGPTSYDMIRWIKRTVKNVKIGHCGTLDPIAEGLLIILLGKATKDQSRLMGQKKTYRCSLRFGSQTDTGDSTGQVVKTTDHVPQLTVESFQKTLSEFLGEQMQIPPMYSALKHEGTPLYKLAREGKEIVREPRKITIDSIDAIEVVGDTAQFRTVCSSGTYVRTLVEDIAKKLDSLATMTFLVREAIGNFHINQAMSGHELKTSTEDQLWDRVLTKY